jgi:dihydroorotate dehydrogenase
MVATGITEKMDVIGCGGILTGDDGMEYFDVGCAGIACASGPAWSDLKFFPSLLEGSTRLQEYLAERAT